MPGSNRRPPALRDEGAGDEELPPWPTWRAGSMDERSERIARRFQWPMLVAALLVIPVIVIEESNFGEPWDR
jgi:hypothetical protein